MKKEIEIPNGIDVEIENKKVKVRGEKGELEKEFKYFYNIKIEKTDNKIVITSDSDKRKVKSMVGTILAHITNLIKGVTEGFTYKMKIVYTHFPITVKTERDKVLISNFLGERISRVAKIVGDTKIEISGQDLTLTGINKEDVAQTAANIEIATKISKKDRRVFQDGIFITSKGK